MLTTVLRIWVPLQGHTCHGDRCKGWSEPGNIKSWLTDSPFSDSTDTTIFFSVFLPTTGLPVGRWYIAGYDGRNILKQAMFKFKLLLVPLDQSVGIWKESLNQILKS